MQRFTNHQNQVNRAAHSGTDVSGSRIPGLSGILLAFCAFLAGIAGLPADAQSQIVIQRPQTDLLICTRFFKTNDLVTAVRSIETAYESELRAQAGLLPSTAGSSDVSINSIQPLPVCNVQENENASGNMAFLKQRFLLGMSDGKWELVSVENPDSFLNFVPGTASPGPIPEEAVTAAYDEIGCLNGINRAPSAAAQAEMLTLAEHARNVSTITSADVCSDEPMNPQLAPIVAGLAKAGVPIDTAAAVRNISQCRNQTTPAVFIERTFRKDCVYEPKFTLHYNTSGVPFNIPFPGEADLKTTNEIKLLVAFLKTRGHDGRDLPNLVPPSMFLSDLAGYAREMFSTAQSVRIQVVRVATMDTGKSTIDVTKGVPPASALGTFDSEPVQITENELKEFISSYDNSGQKPGNREYLIVSTAEGVDETSLSMLARSKFGYSFQVWRNDITPPVPMTRSDWKRLDVSENGSVDLAEAMNSCSFGIEFQIREPKHDPVYWPIAPKDFRVCPREDCKPDNSGNPFNGYRLFRIGYQESSRDVSGEKTLMYLNKGGDSRWTFRNRIFRTSCQDLRLKFNDSKAFIMKGQAPADSDDAELYFRPSLTGLSLTSALFLSGGMTYSLTDPNQAPLVRTALMGTYLDGFEVTVDKDIYSPDSDLSVICTLGDDISINPLQIDMPTFELGPRTFGISPPEITDPEIRNRMMLADWRLECYVQDSNSTDRLDFMSLVVKKDLKLEYTLGFIASDENTPKDKPVPFVHDCEEVQNLLADATLRPQVSADAGFKLSSDLWAASGCHSPVLKVIVQTAYETTVHPLPLSIGNAGGNASESDPNVWNLSEGLAALKESLKNQPHRDPKIASIEVIQEGCQNHVTTEGRICASNTLRLPPNQIGVVLFRYDSRDITATGDDSIDFAASDSGIGISLRDQARGGSVPITLHVRGGASQFAESESVNRSLAWSRAARTLSRFISVSMYQMAAPGTVSCRWAGQQDIPEAGGASVFTNFLEARTQKGFDQCVAADSGLDEVSIRECFNRHIEWIQANLSCTESGSPLIFHKDPAGKSLLTVGSARIDIPNGKVSVATENAHMAQNASICIRIGNRLSGYCAELPARTTTGGKGTR